MGHLQTGWTGHRHEPTQFIIQPVAKRVKTRKTHWIHTLLRGRAHSGRVAPMLRRKEFSRTIRWWLAGLLLIAGCDQATLPQLSHAPLAVPPLPVAVAMNFDEPLRTATLQETLCADTLWEGQLGTSIVGAFERMAQKRYAKVAAASDEKAGALPTITVDLRLANKSFRARTRTGASDNFQAQLTVQLEATFKDETGRVFTHGPLTYDEHFTIFTPTVGSGGTQCMTSNLDAALDKAGDALADQMASVVASIVKETRGAQAAGVAAGSQGTSALVLKASLEDENHNRLLEPGEKVTLRIDAINQGQTPIGSASISLSGSPSIVEAFSTTLAGAPLLMGSVPPGETRATYVAGILPERIQDERIELTLSAVTSEGLSVTPVVLVAAAAASRTVVDAADRYAVIVGLSHYRTPWRGLKGVRGSEIKKLVGLFKHSLGVPDTHILLLQDELAGRADLEEALVGWLPQRASADTIVFFYFAGHSVSDAKTGEVFLLSHDGAPSSSRERWLPLRLLQQRLKSLGAKLSVAVLDGPVAQVGGAGAKKGGSAARPKPANWAGVLGKSAPTEGSGTVIQVVPNRARDGRLSQVVAGLAGDADANHDGRVTLSEWLRALRGNAVTYPTLPPSPAVLSIPLSTQRK